MADELSSIKNLEQVIAWQASRALPASSLTIVTQDEFTHDAVVADRGRFVVFDTN
jgi:hypothetical protein